MVVIDLKVNKDMLDVKFESYKLSLDPIPVLQQPVIDGIHCIELGNEDYSYHQTRMALLHNSLFQDPWSQNSVFYVNGKQNILWTSLRQDGRLTVPRCVWSIPMDYVGSQSHVTICFPHADWAVVCDGKRNLHILYTPSRAAGEPWTSNHTFNLEVSTSSYLLYAVYRITPGGQQIDCVVSSVEHKSKLPGDFSVPNHCTFVSILEWISFACAQNKQVWTEKRTRKLAGSTFPEYVAIDSIGDAICVASENDFKFYFDSEVPVNSSPTCMEIVPQASKYTYLQTPEDVTVYFRLQDNLKKTDIQIRFLPLHMEVLVQGKSVLSGDLGGCIDTGSSTWILDKDKLEVVLSKAEGGLMWQELVKGDKDGEELMDPALVEEVHARLAHLTSDSEVTPSTKVPFNLEQLEECDTTTQQLTFQRIDGNEHHETHRVNMGGHQWLFSGQTSTDSLPAICLRHDVDGILWQPRNVSIEGDLEHFKMQHLATFSALGYVLASKQDKKFTTCSPDFQFAVISDCSRHLYLYCQPESLNSALELRNRKTGESIAHIAKQYVVSLEDCDQILGIRASSQSVFVLSKNTLYAVKVRAQ